MDPSATWRDLAEAFAEGDWEKAEELAGALLHWLDRGGFPPSITGHPDFDKIVARNACDAVLAWDVA